MRAKVTLQSRWERQQFRVPGSGSAQSIGFGKLMNDRAFGQAWIDVRACIEQCLLRLLH